MPVKARHASTDDVSMLLSRWRSGTAVAGLVVLLLTLLGFGVQQWITTGAFDALEADQVAQDAQRVRFGLEADLRLLSNYGSTNSIWDSSYADVQSGDAEAFAADFPPGDVRDLYGLDGVLAISRDGALRAGGVVTGAGGSAAYARPPAGLATPQELGRLFDPAAAAGEARCGLVRSAAAPYLFCGFAAHRSDGGDAVSGGLVYLRALDGAGLARFGDQISMPLALVTGTPREGLRGKASLDTALGRLGVSTGTVGDDRVALDVQVPAVDGGSVRLEALRPRPIHGHAQSVAHRLMVVMGVLGSLLFGAVVLLTRWEVHERVRPLRRTAEEVIRSGDRTLRIGGAGEGELGALARTLDEMLDAMSAQDEQLSRVVAAREAQLRQSYVQQRLAGQHVRHRARVAIDETAAAVVDQLQEVVREVEAMEEAVDTTAERITAAEELTRSVQIRAASGRHAADAVAESLERVSGIAQMIAGVAEQTNLLSLNATIEAARAGSAGKGFAVVAGEVKALASSTTHSTDQIASTLGGLERDVSAMAGAIGEMTDGVAGIGQHAAELADVASRQRSQMAALDGVMRGVMARIAAMSTVTDTLERRAHERVPAEGVVEIEAQGRILTAVLLDLSEGGLRCSLDTPEVPPLQGEVGVVLGLSDQREAFQALVVRAPTPDSDGREVALEFRRPSPAGMALVRDYIAALIGAEA